MALEYELQQFNNINKTFSVQPFQGETESNYWLIKTILDFKLMGEMNPSIGFGKKRTIERDLTNNKHEIINEKIWRIGAEKRF